MLDLTEDDHCKLYEILVCVVTFGTVCGFGLVGNMTSFFVLLKHSTDKVAIVLLQAICVSDTMLLLASVVMYVLPTMEAHFFGVGSTQDVPQYAIHVWPFAMIAHTLTIWVTVLVTFTRYRALCTPHQYNTATMKRTIGKVLVVFLFSAIFNLPRFFEHHVMSISTRAVNGSTTLLVMNLGDSKTYQVIYSIVAYFLVMYIIPLVSLSWMNIKLICSLQEFNRSRRRFFQATENQEPTRDHLTICIIVIVCVFIICQTPALVNQIFWAALPQSQRECGKFHYYYTQLSDLLVVVNSACNIIVYCMSGKTFRNLFKQQLLSRCCKLCGDGEVRV